METFSQNQPWNKVHRLLVIDEQQSNLPEGKFVLVDDVLSALQQLARDFRKTFTGTVIGLTGSNGKTTCKELFRDVLATTYDKRTPPKTISTTTLVFHFPF